PRGTMREQNFATIVRLRPPGLQPQTQKPAELRCALFSLPAPGAPREELPVNRTIQSALSLFERSPTLKVSVETRPRGERSEPWPQNRPTRPAADENFQLALDAPADES